MSIEQGNVYRKKVVPWYDSDPTCIISIFFLFFIFLFGIMGIIEATDNIETKAYIWVPILLTVLSGFVFISIIIRLIKRYIVEDQDSFLMDFSKDIFKEYRK